MKKKQILVITGTRAEYGLLRPTLEAIRKSPRLNLRLLITGMHFLEIYGHTIEEIRRDQIPITHEVPITPHLSMLGWLTQEIEGINAVCSKEKPDLILILGDRDEPLAAAIVGSHLNIPVAHIHGGDITGEVTVDDRIRDAITSFSTLHFPISRKSAQRIKQILGHKAKNIFIVGPVGHEEMTQVWDKDILANKYHVSASRPWLLFFMHPTPLTTTSFKDQIHPALEALKEIPAEIIGIYPNSDTGSEVFLNEMKQTHIFTKLFPSLPRKDYLSFLRHSHCFIGNSSSTVLEAPFFNTFVVNIGRRQENRSIYSHKTDVSFNKKAIRTSIVQYLNQPKIIEASKLPTRLPSQLIVSHIESFLMHDNYKK